MSIQYIDVTTPVQKRLASAHQDSLSQCLHDRSQYLYKSIPQCYHLHQKNPFHQQHQTTMEKSLTATSEAPKQHITDIMPQTKSWTVRVTVSEVIPTMQCATGSRLKRYVFVDAEGTQVVASIYDPDLEILAPMIHLYAVYDISNAGVRLTNQQYKILDAPFQWIIKRQTLIQPVPNVTAYLRYLVGGITPLIHLPEAAKSGQTTADIIGIVIDCDDVKTVKSGKNEVQHFTIIDSDMFPVRITLWDDMILLHGPALIEAASKQSVIIARRMALRTYDSISLSTKNASSIAVDPPVHAADELKAWFHTIPPNELETLKARKTASYTQALVSAGRVNAYQVADLKRIMKTGDYRLRGYLRLIDEDQQLYYIACSSCRTKVKAELNQKYICFICKSDAVAKLRPLVVLTVIDQSDTMEIAALDEMAERILQTTAKDLERLHNKGEKFDFGSIKEDLKVGKYLIWLSRTPGNQRMLLRAYCTESLLAIENTGTSSGQDSSSPQSSSSVKRLPARDQECELPLSPLKRQLSSITINAGTSSKRPLLFDEASARNEKGNEGPMKE